MRRSSFAVAIVLPATMGILAVLAACVGDSPDSPSSTSSGGASSGTTSSSGASSSGTSSSGATSSSGGQGGDGGDAGPTPLTGKVDTSFKNGARTDVSIDYVYAVAVDAKKRIYVVGSKTACAAGSTGNADFAVARYLENGDLDTTFGSSGRMCVDFLGSNKPDEAHDVAIDDQNRIVLVGVSDSLSNARISVARLAENGDLDTSFNSTGKLTIGSSQSTGNAVALDGSTIYVVGSDSAVPTLGSVGYLARVTSAGVLDNGFGNVKSETDARSLEAIALAGGFVYVAGASSADTPARAIVFRYNTSGVRDNSFSPQKVPSSSANYDDALSFAIAASGKVVSAGIANGDSSQILGASGPLFAARFTSAGPLDTSFNATGANKGVAIVSSVNGHTRQRGASAVDRDGRLVLAGIFEPQDGGARDPGLARMNDDGTPDNAFGTSGVARANATAAQAYVVDVARDPTTGKIVVLSAQTAAGTFSLFRFE